MFEDSCFWNDGGASNVTGFQADGALESGSHKWKGWQREQSRAAPWEAYSQWECK